MRQVLALLILAGLSAPSFAESDAGWLDKEEARSLQSNLENTLQTHFDVLKGESEPAYFLSYALTHSEGLRISGVEGQHLQTRRWASRLLDVDLRVGDMSLDNTHRQRGGSGPPRLDRRAASSGARRLLTTSTGR